MLGAKPSLFTLFARHSSMCLRYALESVEFATLKARFGVKKVPEMVARYNISPTQSVPAILSSAQEEISLPLWGIPRQGGKGFHFNARAETVFELPSFKDSFEAGRCLMIADSFYEWKKPNNDPFRLRLKAEGAKERLFAFAGIANESGCCMITVAPNKLVASVHDRMPAILRKEDEKDYLKLPARDALELLMPFPAERMEIDALSREINSSRNEGKELVRVIRKEERLDAWQ